MTTRIPSTEPRSPSCPTDAGFPDHQSGVAPVCTTKSFAGSQRQSHGSKLSFSLSASLPKFGPRLGRISLVRPPIAAPHDTSTITFESPSLLVVTSRGVVPHLSRDHCNSAEAIRWINVPFESFLEQSTPMPTIQPGPCPLHTFLGFDTQKHIVSLCLRDPLNSQEMPPNGNKFITTNCLRGVRKVTPTDWKRYAFQMQPDIVFALSDTPFTAPPHSQKRITKSIERSVEWLVNLLQAPEDGDMSPSSQRTEGHAQQRLPNVIVNMAGGCSIPAREAFARSLCETLHGPEREAIKPLNCLNDGLAGYSVDLATLRAAMATSLASHRSATHHEQQSVEDMFNGAVAPMHMATTEVGTRSESLQSAVSSSVVPIIKASLNYLPEQQLRLVTGVRSPHEILRLILDVGLDLFDAGLAIATANVGVALDFVFPLSHLLASQILHSTIDVESHREDGRKVMYGTPHTRAYVHHLLNTHEMSAYTLLVAHNLAVLDSFFAGIREVIGRDSCDVARFAREVERFERRYDESMTVLSAAKRDWNHVELARGKGRLARERKRESPKGNNH